MSEHQAPSDTPATKPDPNDILFKSLEKYLKNMANVLPAPYASQDSNRLTLIYFVVSSLDLVGKLDLVDRKQIIDFIYSQQVLPDSSDAGESISAVRTTIVRIRSVSSHATQARTAVCADSVAVLSQGTTTTLSV